MCYDRSWFTSQEQKAKTDERKPEMKDKRSGPAERGLFRPSQSLAGRLLPLLPYQAKRLIMAG
jgi:hypothetical protein